MILVTTSTVLSFLGMISSAMTLTTGRQVRRFRLESLLIWIMTTVWGATAVFSNVLPINSEESAEANVIIYLNRFFSIISV
jgi:hypothetical protein